jgi:hypothetical protein
VRGAEGACRLAALARFSFLDDLAARSSKGFVLNYLNLFEHRHPCMHARSRTPPRRRAAAREQAPTPQHSRLAGLLAVPNLLLPFLRSACRQQRPTGPAPAVPHCSAGTRAPPPPLPR